MTPVPPEQLLADGFARHAAQWAASQGAPARTIEHVRRVAAALSLAVSAGHVCLPLAAWARESGAGEPAALRAALLASRIVGTPAAPGALPYAPSASC